MFLARPFPPGVVGGTAVDGTLAGEAHVLGLVGVDAGGEVGAVEPFPASWHQRVEFGLEGEEEGGVLLDHEVHAAFKAYGTGCVGTGGHHNPASAGFGACGDGRGDRLLVLGGCSLGGSAVFGNVEGSVGELWLDDFGLDGAILRVPGARCRQGWHQQAQKNQGILFHGYVLWL